MSGETYYRYCNLAIIILSAICNSFVVQVLSTINHQITTYIPAITSTQISLCALIFMFVHPFVIFPSNYILDMYPIKLGVSINCVFVIVGSLIRLLIGSNIIWVIVGNAIIAMGNVFIINISAKFSSIWFSDHKLLVTSLIVFANAISGQIGAALSPLFVKEGLTPQKGKQSIISYTFYTTLFIVSVMTVNLIFFRSSPETKEKCLNKTLLRKKDEKPYKQTIKTLFSSKNYRLFLCVMMLSISILNCFATYIELYIIPFGLTSNIAGISTAISVVFGLICSVVSGIVIKKYQQHFKKIIMIQYGMGIVSLGLFLIGLEFKNMILYWTSIVLFGASLYSILPGVIQYSCESMHPVGEATVSGLLFGFGQLFSFGMGLLQSYLLKDKTQEGTIYTISINIGMFLISLILFSLTSKAKMKETELLTENDLD